MNNQRSEQLRKENLNYSGTGGVSEENKSQGFLPAFMDVLSGDVVLSRFRNGVLAPFHTLDGLPEPWVIARDVHGHVTEIKSSVVSGFVRLGQFFTREEAAALVRI